MRRDETRCRAPPRDGWSDVIEWSAGHTRSSALDQIDGDNFSDLEVAWIWRGDNFGPNIDYFNRSTPTYVDGVVYTVASPRRQVVAIDPGTGETLWTFREPESVRHLRSPRQAYGKGVAYAEVNGRGVIFVTSPAFFLWALDAQTGRPLESGRSVGRRRGACAAVGGCSGDRRVRAAGRRGGVRTRSEDGRTVVLGGLRSDSPDAGPDSVLRQALGDRGGLSGHQGHAFRDGLGARRRHLFKMLGPQNIWIPVGDILDSSVGIDGPARG